MVGKIIKYGLVTGAGLAVAGGVMLGTDVGSYVCSSTRAARAAVKENIPIDFELRRARDLVDELTPEIQSCVRQVAKQEVEIAALRRELEQARGNLQTERVRVQKLRDALGSDESSFVFSGVRYTREQVKEDLARRFDLLKDAEAVQAGKEKLIQNRERSLAAAVQVLERTRSQRALLEGQIASLESQHQLVKAAAAGSGSSIDTGKLAQTEQAIARVKKQLDVAERVLAHEARFTTPIAVDVVNEPELLTQVDEHLKGDGGAVAASDGKPKDEPAVAGTRP